MISDLDPRTLLWLDYQNFAADFVKLKLPVGGAADWLDYEMQEKLRAQVYKIGVARVILDGCDTPEQIELGQRLGITLFQGEAVSALTI